MSASHRATPEQKPVKFVELEELSNGMPGLTSAHGRVLAEAAGICLESQQHEPGVKFPRAGLMLDDIHVVWQAADDQQRRCYADMQEATEWGACAVAILMIKEATGKVVVERSKKGTGFDYWIGDSDGDVDANPFKGAARLEVSGILNGSKSQIESRIRLKKYQIKPTDHLADGFVAVIEFGKPVACVENK